MSTESNISRSAIMRAGAATAPNAPVAGGKPGLLLSHLMVVRFGALSKQGYGVQAASDEDGICAAQPVLAAGALLINGALASGGAVDLSGGPRNVVLDSSSAGDTTQTVTVVGRDAVGNEQTEVLAANGQTLVVGNKFFSYIESATASAAFAGNVNLGTGVKMGLPCLVRAGSILQVTMDGAVTTWTPHNASSSNGLGGFSAASAPNAAREYAVLIEVYDSTNYDPPTAL